jgi:hypothetical protein
MGMKQKKKIFEKKIQNGRLKKRSPSLKKKLWIGPWISRID